MQLCKVNKNPLFTFMRTGVLLFVLANMSAIIHVVEWLPLDRYNHGDH